MKVTTQHIISAIIGHWRNGAALAEINKVTAVPISVIIKIISKYEAESNDRERQA